jgi:hypothetical protein
VGEFAAQLDGLEIGNAERRVADALPEFAQPFDPALGRVTGNQCRIDGADRYSRHPVRMEIVLGERLINPRLIGAERSAALQQQRDPLERGALPAPAFGLRYVRIGHFDQDIWTV